ncbi:transcriptional repressor [Clostridium sp. 'deep sea']|uniref:Fur family transcriptional regulator n=1 Tax=Clostridium sp. 'deep sea' TaxID=2779445 RepID=UPI00189647E8|nr:Fur family transcriptional regulator [Clostridium sp. 'deep sea']QOR33719.1 transcriptional repressor [Clostridium sp. 'deep sea']
MEQIIDSVRKKLKENDLRLTSQRQAILQTLLEYRHSHLSVEELYNITHEHYPDLGIATVYRTLDTFVELGIVHKMEFGDKGARYELKINDEEHYHHHLFCVSCGAIIEFNDDLLEKLEDRIMKENKFLIKDHSLRFYGLCYDCQQQGIK